ncbi:MAG: hypothetical protein DLM70_04155 [Chloroflexi bacterium]|nr:MAG: hypothetical protein DLM70_04155 [Chloroflexota bacterium]
MPRSAYNVGQTILIVSLREPTIITAPGPLDARQYRRIDDTMDTEKEGGRPSATHVVEARTAPPKMGALTNDASH